MRTAALIWLFAALLSSACSRPDTQESFVRADKALDGVYIFDFELEGNGASYDFSIWGVSRDKAVYGEELRVQWLSPSGSSFSETVYMKCITPSGERELYRSAVAPDAEGKWRISIRTLPEDELAGLGVICRKR